MLLRAGSIFILGMTLTGTAMSTTYPNPYIASFSPASGPAGTVVSVTGSGFTGLTAAWVGSGHDAGVHVVSDTLVQVTVPKDATTAHIAVLNPSHSHFSASNFTVSAGTTSGSSTSTSGSSATYTVSGTVTGYKNSSVRLTGPTSHTATTDANGNFSFTGIANGTYTVAPAAAGYTFSPASLAKSVNGSALSGVNFTATTTSATTYSIAGTVSGAVASGVTLTLNGANVGAAASDLGGNYTFTGLAGGTYTVNASLAGHSFSQTRTVTLGSTDSTADNFSSSTTPGTATVNFTVDASLPQATVGKTYSNTVVSGISGGTAPYGYQTDVIANGTPPLGLVLGTAGTLTGTPKVAGTYSFNVCAHDAAGNASTCHATKLVVAAATTTSSSSSGSSTSTGSTTTSTAASGTSWVYYNGTFDWPGDYSFVATPNYKDTAGDPLTGAYDIKVTITSAWGGWQPYALNWAFNDSSYHYLVFALKPTVAHQKWNVYFMNVGDTPVTGSDGLQIYVDPTLYGPAPVVGEWNTYKIPLSALGVAGKSIYKFCIHDETGLSSNVWYVDNVGFSP